MVETIDTREVGRYCVLVGWRTGGTVDRALLLCYGILLLLLLCYGILLLLCYNVITLQQCYALNVKVL